MAYTGKENSIYIELKDRFIESELQQLTQQDLQILYDFDKEYCLILKDNQVKFVNKTKKQSKYGSYFEYSFIDKTNFKMLNNLKVVVETMTPTGTTRKPIALVDFYIYARKQDVVKPKNGVDFLINEDDKDVVNFWYGFTDIEPKEKVVFKDVKDFWILVYVNLCSKDNIQYRHLRKLLKHILVYPHLKSSIATVMAGEQGIGKNIFMSMLESWVYPKNYLEVTNTQHLVKYNGGIEAKLIINANESVFAFDKSVAGMMKGLITEPKVQVEHKGQMPYTVNNYTNLFILSNNILECALVEKGNRRYFCLDTQKELPQEHLDKVYSLVKDVKYLGKLRKYLKEHTSIKNYKPHKFPNTKTEALIQGSIMEQDLQLLVSMANGEINDLDAYVDKGGTRTAIEFKWDTKLNDFVFKINSTSFFNLYKAFIINNNKKVYNQTSFGITIKEYISKHLSKDKILNECNKDYMSGGFVYYSLSIKGICKILDKETGNRIHSKKIMEKYAIYPYEDFK